jgi:hypothetical protein
LVVKPIGQVARHGAAPETDVDVRFLARHVPLDLERLDVDRRRNAVERHVDDGGDTAGRRRAGRGREALPFGAAGLVDVHMGVHQTGHQDLVVAEIHHLRRGQGRAQRLDRHDPAVPHTDAAGHFTGGGAHPRGADEQVEGRAHTPARSRSATMRTASATAGATEASNTLGTM